MLNSRGAAIKANAEMFHILKVAHHFEVVLLCGKLKSASSNGSVTPLHLP